MTRNESGGIIVPSFVLTLMGAMLSLLVAANSYFVKRLVDQLDATREIVWSLRQEVVILKLTVNNLVLKHKEISIENVLGGE